MTDTPENIIRVIPLGIAHARDVAELHRLGINTGFLSSLGAGFLTQLYRAIPSTQAGFGFVAIEGESRVCGFIACALSTGRLYKQVLLKRGFFMALSILKYMVRPTVIKRMFATLMYPAQVDQLLPPAEVLSIAVGESARGCGVGRKLMLAAMDEFRRRGTDSVKVAVWDGNEGANAFYKNCGFTLSWQKMHHGLKMNIYSMRIEN